ncbi:ABC transporter permease [Paraconexibacter antarcticus]|uniref:ABC transporter permease n=1 Tax=Paraconexibacter antarcticus TaxID=2949664 RepID=A0ABY5E0F5_9ACTN|nr:ABC transporter permease [Paraconexibacter antarcticus]UTI66294.1 ABC transporter permease [Paraconexibacter antarcticus]
MSTVPANAVPAAPAPATPRGRVTFPRVLRSEWTKLWSLRSTRWSLLAAFVAMVALGPAIAAVRMSRWSHLSVRDRIAYDAIDNGVGGYHLAQLAIGVLGVLVISAEYSTGMIRSSMMAVPRRLPVLGAKLAVYAVVSFVLMLVATVISFFAVEAIVRGHHVQRAIGDPRALRAVVGTALFLTVLGAMALGLGALTRNTAGGIATLVGLLFVLPGITALLPSATADAISPYLPLNAGFPVTTSTFENPHHLSPWGGFGMFCAYAAVLVLAAAVQLRRRDA